MESFRNRVTNKEHRHQPDKRPRRDPDTLTDAGMSLDCRYGRYTHECVLPLAYLPQHLAEIVGLAIATFGIGSALPVLIRGSDPELPAWSRARVRLIAAAAVLFSIGAGVSGFLLDAEPPGGTAGGHWGTTADKALLGIWLVG